MKTHRTFVVVLFSVVFGVFFGYKASGEPENQGVVQLTESEIRNCATRLIIEQLPCTHCMVDRQSFLANPAAVSELAQHLKEIVRQYPELREFVGRYGVPIGKRRAMITIELVDGQPDVPPEMEAILARFCSWIVEKKIVHREQWRDNNIVTVDYAELYFEIHHPIAVWRLIERIAKVSPRFSISSRDDGEEFPKLGGKSYPGARYESTGIGMTKSEHGQHTIEFTGYFIEFTGTTPDLEIVTSEEIDKDGHNVVREYYKNTGVWWFVCNSEGVKLIRQSK